MFRSLVSRWFPRAAPAAPPPTAIVAPDADRLGLEAFARGDMPAALHHFGAALAAHPGDAQRRYHLASALAGSGDLAAAAPLALAAYHADPASADRAACLRFVTVNLDPRHAPDDAFWSAIARGNRALAESRDEDALQVFRTLVAIEPDSVVAHDRLGAALVRLRRFEEAGAHLQAAARGGWPLAGMADFSAAHLDGCAAGVDWRDYPTGLAAAAPRGGRPRATVLIGCDAVYLRRFAPALLNSIARNGALDVRVHLHVLDADEAARRLCAGLVSRADLPVEVSHGPDAFAGADRRLVYACARFFVAPALLERDGVPVLVLDADLLVLRPLEALVARLERADFAAAPGEAGQSEPAERLWASLVWFGAGAAGRQAASLVANYILRAIAAGRGAWFLDQFALLGAEAWARRTGRCAFDLLPAGILLSGPEPDLAPPADAPLAATFWALANSMPLHAGRVEHPYYRSFDTQ